MSFPSGGGAPFGMPGHMAPGMAPTQFQSFGGMTGGPVQGMGVQMRMGLLPTTTAATRMRQPRPTVATNVIPGQKPVGNSQQAPDPNKPKTTVFVGNISEKAPDALVRGLLIKCGNMLSWKRVQGATGKLQAFGFCEYSDPEASLRAIRLLHDLELGDKKLVVKVDAKTRAQLDEYLADKNKANGTEANGEEVNEFTRNADVMVKEQLHQLMSDFQHQLSRQFQSNEEKKEKQPKKQQEERESVEELPMDDDKKHIISREIDRFRDTYRANEEREKTKEERIAERKEREREREREKELREKERERERERDRTRRDHGDRDRERKRDREREREHEREKKRREREREEEKEREEREERHRERTRSRSRDRGRDSRDHLDEEEEYEKRKLERKLREKEEAYQERLRNWESRERKKARDYDKYKEKLAGERIEQDKEAKRLKEFLEDYEDERDDPKYYKGSALDRRRKEREKEMDMDSRDCKKEMEEFEDIKRRILEEGASDAEEEIETLELEQEKHKKPQLGERSPFPRVEEIKPTLKPTFEPAREEVPVPVVAPIPAAPVAKQRTPESDSSPEVIEAEDSPEDSRDSFRPAPREEEVVPPEPKPRLSFGGLKLVGSNTSLTPDNSESVGASSPHQQQQHQPPPQEPPPRQQPQQQQERHSNQSSASSKRRKLTVGDVFNEDDDTSDSGRKKHKLVPIEYSEEEMKAVGQAQLIASAAEEKRKTIKNLIERIPTAKEKLFNYKVDWNIVDEVLMERRIKPWINKKIIEYIGEEEATLTDFICSKLLAHSSAASILNDISMVLDEEAEVFVVKMWRLLIYEVEAKKHGLVK